MNEAMISFVSSSSCFAIIPFRARHKMPERKFQFRVRQAAMQALKRCATKISKLPGKKTETPRSIPVRYRFNRRQQLRALEGLEQRDRSAQGLGYFKISA